MDDAMAKLNDLLNKRQKIVNDISGVSSLIQKGEKLGKDTSPLFDRQAKLQLSMQKLDVDLKFAGQYSGDLPNGVESVLTYTIPCKW